MTPYDYALLAQEAYTAKPDIGVAESASRAIVRDTPGGLVIAFPGTDNNASFAADIDTLIVSVPGIGELHRGFWEAWSALAVPVGAITGEKPVTFVGHSLGAAIAIIAGMMRKFSGKPVAGVYGFEPPRVSPHDVSAALAGVPVYLTKNGNDMVPEVPLWWHHPAPVTQIGHAAHPFANIDDHMLARVIAALAPATAAVA